MNLSGAFGTFPTLLALSGSHLASGSKLGKAREEVNTYVRESFWLDMGEGLLFQIGCGTRGFELDV
jgi:hypothetical protein